MMDEKIREVVWTTPFIDTHEHLVEESDRLAGSAEASLLPADDWSSVFHQYLSDDLDSAGMPGEALQRFYAPGLGPAEKFKLIEPWWARVRFTGYGRAVRESLRGLYGEDDLTAESAPRLAEKYRDLVRPGFYATVLRQRSNIEACHVNSLQRIFMETAQPDLLPQDLSFYEFARAGAHDIAQVEAETGRKIATLDDWLGAIDEYFAKYGPRAVAVKNQSAYGRRLDYDSVPRERAAAAFDGMHNSWRLLGPEDVKTAQDFLFRYCIGKAAEHRLPVKLHTGYYAGRNPMPLSRLRRNASDLCQLLKDFPDTPFVLMHVGYPYQDEFIALAKHYRNAYVDMCWAWIINPAASVRFLREFLVSAPASKLFAFGGDYIAVENVYGHSEIARRGIAETLAGLVADGWIGEDDAVELARRIMRGNALDLFPPQRAA
jgi:predicted TIM-barrel fold metal-dependent hydrolase